MTIVRFLLFLFIGFIIPGWLLVKDTGVFSSGAEKGPEEVIQAFFKAANERKYMEAKQYLLQDTIRHIKDHGVDDWKYLADWLTKQGTLQTVEVSKVTREEEEYPAYTVLERFADGSVQKVWLELIKEDGQWKISWHPQYLWMDVKQIFNEYVFQDYAVRIHEENSYNERENSYNESPFFEVLKSGHQVFSSLGDEGRLFWLGFPDYDEHGKKLNSLVPMGKDITGDGKPDLVMSEYMGGTQGPTYVHIFQIGKEFRHIATIEAGIGDNFLDVADLDGDSALEFIIDDQTSAFCGSNDWRPVYCGVPKVILRFRNGAYRVASDLMSKPAPPPPELAKRAQQVQDEVRQRRQVPPVEKGEEIDLVPEDLWGYMLELIYTGHMGLAWQFLEMAWPPGVAGKDEFLRNFRTQLAHSPFWPLDDEHAINFYDQYYEYFRTEEIKEEAEETKEKDKKTKDKK